MSADKYDLIVFGSGPAGEKGAAQAAYFGKKVALIEKKIESGGRTPAVGPEPKRTPTKVIDLVSVLQESLAQAGKGGARKAKAAPSPAVCFNIARRESMTGLP